MYDYFEIGYDFKSDMWKLLVVGLRFLVIEVLNDFFDYWIVSI